MGYRDELEGALHRIEVLQDRERALLKEVEVARAGALAPPPPPAPPPPLRYPWLKVLAALGLTFLAYVVVIAVFDGEPPDRNASLACARLGVALPFAVSARIWWTRRLDTHWLVATFVRATLLLALGAPTVWRLSHFGESFVFFWWGPTLGVAVLLGEILWASRVTGGTAERA